jgi:hypothetical protein
MKSNRYAAIITQRRDFGRGVRDAGEVRLVTEGSQDQ